MSLLAASNVIGVLVADSNRMQAQLLTNALRRRPEFEVGSCPVEITAILQSVSTSLPRVALVALGPVGMAETMATLRNFHLAHPEIAKVLLVDTCDRELVVNAFRSGTRGIFPITEADLRQLCKCILRVAAGQIWADTEQLNQLLETISEVPSMRVLNTKGATLLTPREEQVVALVVEGMGNRLIARELSLSEHTIKKYMFRIFEKLGISSRVELVLYALSNGEVRRAEWIVAGGQVPPAA
ncbi:MAG TPA: response regulator transcription factor [Candidatus Sulfotelmatobacter sp.]|jgi:DNA-binding NarL/FixJ family response regulator